MGHSVRCQDVTTHWDRKANACVPCNVKVPPGRQLSKNCGYDDNGGSHEPTTKPCKENTFNDGGRTHCLDCSVCPPGFTEIKCTRETDTGCIEPRSNTTEVPLRATSQHVSAFSTKASTTYYGSMVTQIPPSVQNAAHSVALWAVLVAILISLMLAVTACIVIMKRKKGRHMMMIYNRRSSTTNEGFSPLATSASSSDLDEILSPNVLSAPLQTVLDNLDILEELVILLDPETNGIKSTKHLASHCSFPSTWITYTYSMKDTKSPLKAVLEGVTSRHPDWTVGHLAKLLRLIERNDAIAVLAKIRRNEIDM